MVNNSQLARERDDVRKMASTDRVSVNYGNNGALEIYSHGEHHTGRKTEEGIEILNGDFDGSMTEETLEEDGANVEEYEDGSMVSYEDFP